MSRTGAGRPEIRLHLGYPYIEIERPGVPSTHVALDAPDVADALRHSVAAAPRGARFTAILPESEVWRGTVSGHDAGRAAARAAGAALGVTPASLMVRLGPRGGDGRRPAAATPRATVAEARAFLGRAGLRPSRIIAAGAFPGFAAPPELGRFGPPSDVRLGAASASATLAAALGLLAWLGPWSAGPPAPEAQMLPPVVIAPVTPDPTQLAYAAPPPKARPADLAPRSAPGSLGAPSVLALGPPVLAARNIPDDVKPFAATDARVPSVIDAARPRARPGGSPISAAAAPQAEVLSGPSPRPRPRQADSATATPAQVAAPSDANVLGEGPRARPLGMIFAATGTADLVATLDSSLTTPAVAATRDPTEAGPRARPQTAAAAPRRPAPNLVASLSPSATAVAPERRRIAPTKAAPPPVAAERVPVATPVRVKPAPAPTVGAAPQPVRQVAATPQPARAPARTLQPVLQAAAPKAAAPVRSTSLARASTPAKAAAPAREPSLGRNSVSLIGIFGGATGRHALVQLPDGSTERIRQGETFRGVQVTSIGDGEVRLRGHGRESVLRLPD